MCINSKIKTVFTHLTSYNALALFRLIFGGIYYELSDSKIIRSVAKIYSITYLIVNVVCFPYSSGINPLTLHMMVELTECSTYILLSHVTDERNEPSPFNSSRLPFIIFIIIVTRNLNIILFISGGHFSFISLVNDFFKYLACITGRLNAVFAYDVYRKQIKSLKKSLELKLAFENSSEGEKAVHIRAFSDGYSELLGKFFSANYARKVQIRCGFVFDFLKVICFVSFTLSGKVFVTIHSNRLAAWSGELLLSIFTVCLPAILSEITHHHIDEAKYLILGHLFTYKDANLRSEIHAAVEYIETHKTKYALWNDVPLNLSLVFSFINICAAFIIAIMQFIY